MLDWLNPFGKKGRKGSLKTLRSTILLDEIWYLQTYPETRGAAVDAAQHYLLYGAAEGRSPSLYFDGSWYLENNEDVALAGLNPLLHYLDHGWREKRHPHPLFDINWYEEQAGFSQLGHVDPLTHYLMEGWRAGLSPHRLFDPELYRQLYPQTIGANPLLCFLLSDFYDLQQTHLLFDPVWYLQNNEDVAKAELSPLLHYVRSGWKDHRQPHPLFDAAWYLQQNPDVAETQANPLLHFLRYGWVDERSPHPLFDVKWYANCYQDLKSTQLNPLLQYCGAGWLEGRSPHPLFDGQQYLTNNPDVKKAGMNPLVHYVQSGWREKRTSHPLFDPNWYLNRYPDVAAEGMDPLRHYLSSGWVENRNPGPFFDTFWYRSNYGDDGQPNECPLSKYLSRPEFGDRAPHLLFDPAWYRASYGTEIGGVNPLVDYVSCGIESGRLPSPDFEGVVASLGIKLSSPRAIARAAFEQVLSSDSRHAVIAKARRPGRKVLDVHYEVWRAPASLEGQTVCLFVSYLPDGRVPRSTLHYMRALSLEGVAVVLIAASRNAGLPRGRHYINNASVGLIARDNVGYDFACWALGMQVLPGILKARTIIFANDSVFGPLAQASLTKLLRRIEVSDADYLGLTQSWQLKHHYQSYFFALKRGALLHPGVRYLWTNLECVEDRDDAIKCYEANMLHTMKSLGLQTEVLFPLNDRDSKKDVNPTLDHWRELVDEDFPFIKVQALRDNISGVDRSNWQAEVTMDAELRQAIIERLASSEELTRKATIARPGR